jgi:hypothetical protein
MLKEDKWPFFKASRQLPALFSGAVCSEPQGGTWPNMLLVGLER